MEGLLRWIGGRWPFVPLDDSSLCPVIVSYLILSGSIPLIQVCNGFVNSSFDSLDCSSSGENRAETRKSPIGVSCNCLCVSSSRYSLYFILGD